MRTISLILLASTFAVCGQSVQRQSDTPYAITAKDANSQVWERTTYEHSPDGKQVPKVHRYTELATGLNYLKDGEWTASKEEIQILPTGGAAATQGQHQAYFPGNIYQGQIELVTPDGKHLKSRPLGLSYDDGQNTVLIAELKDSTGYLVGSNQVVYPDAFTDFKADLRYTYTKAGFEQDVILREQPPAPAAFNMAPDQTHLQLLTEFFDTEPTKKQKREADEELSFGKMKMVRGKAFGTPGTEKGKRIAVDKSWQKLGGRDFLVEELPVSDMAEELEALPEPAQQLSRNNSSIRNKLSSTRLLPSLRLAQASTNTLQLAKADLNQQKGFVLDYVTINADTNNFTFQKDTTYHVSGFLFLRGTNFIEGGAVIKAGTDYAEMDVYGDDKLIYLTEADHPAVFTSMNDDSIGAIISGSTGIPNPTDVAFFLVYEHDRHILHDLRFQYAMWPVYNSGGDIVMQDCQFLNVNTAVTANNINLQNVLISQGVEYGDPALAAYGNLVAENLTADHLVAGFIAGGVSGVYLTNCLITSSGTLLTGTVTNRVICLPFPSTAIYQTAAAAGNYLAGDSPYRNIGTANIDSNLLVQLRTMTTYAPQDGSYPDTNAASVDLGYHYPVNEDSDHDGLPDWWEWKWFGTFSMMGTNVDGNDNTLLYDYQHGLDPSKINFVHIKGDNNYVRTNQSQVFLERVSGLPAFYTVQVDNTNFMAATNWLPYAGPIVKVNLGTNQGWHEIWIGLKGWPANAKAIWQWKRLKLDTSPPQIGILSPATSQVDQPVIQLKGYSPEALDHFSYDLSNAAGVVTNQQLLLLDQYHDDVTWEFTTNTFQAFDVPLTNGPNIFTIHAEDLAGNVTTTNFTFLLDYSAKTNPPLVQINWPTNTTEIADSSFTLDGQINDPSAKVTVSITSTNGTTNMVSGAVDRAGRFWAEGLLLESGTNLVSVTVKDAAGNVATTNLFVTKSTLVMNMNSVDNDPRLWQATIDLTGHISDPTYAIWVNGVKGHNNGDGTWSATGVPTKVDGAIGFTMTAYSPDEAQPDGSHGNP